MGIREKYRSSFACSVESMQPGGVAVIVYQPRSTGRSTSPLSCPSRAFHVGYDASGAECRGSGALEVKSSRVTF